MTRHSAARLDPLPEMMMGQAVWSPRRHDLPGWLFIGWCYLSSAMGMVMSIYIVFTEPLLNSRVLALLLFMVAITVLHWRLGGKVRQFSRFGWYGAMLELAGALAAKAGLFGIVGLLIGVFEVLWMRYFWTRRQQFDVHLGD